MNNAHKLLARYIVCDYVAANIAWMLFIAIRYYLTKDSIYMQDVKSLWQYMQFRDVYRGQILFPILMVFIFYLSGYYNTVYFKSRLQEFLTTLFSSFIVAIISYFIILINDNFVERQRNYELIASMWGIIFICVYLPRFLTTRSIMKKIQHGHICFRTLIIGLNQSTVAVKNAIKNSRYSMGYKIVGVIPFDNEPPGDEFDLPVFKMSDLDEICRNQNIQNIIIATENRDNKTTLNLINRLFRYDIPIKVAPELYDIITSRVRHVNIIEEPFINITQNAMPEWQKSVKRALDIVVSVIALICLSPFFLLIALLIKHDSKGPVLYRQERIGMRGKTFHIYKFRTMVANAESDRKPQLTSENDPRITKIGHFLRKYRIDETPQFWNVVKGDMSIVGPRPERRYFADKIIDTAPYYALTYQVRPGITSWGMVKFGYAQNVDEMIERSKYDLIYLENMSLLVDIKIIIYTIKTVLTGKGM